ncbi:MAG: hypothetical protein K5656_05060 [Lachnospiraceae bacterium]|nr:hypothetical protein [Lachnospiraceae bacterium]
MPKDYENLTSEEKRKMGDGIVSEKEELNKAVSDDLNTKLEAKFGEQQAEGEWVVKPVFETNYKTAMVMWMIAIKDMSLSEAASIDINSENYDNLSNEFVDFLYINSVKKRGNEYIGGCSTAIARVYNKAKNIVDNYTIPNVDYRNIDQFEAQVPVLLELSNISNEYDKSAFTFATGQPYKIDGYEELVDYNTIDTERKQGRDYDPFSVFTGKDYSKLTDRKRSDVAEEIRNDSFYHDSFLRGINSALEWSDYNPENVLLARSELNELRNKPYKEASKVDIDLKAGQKKIALRDKDSEGLLYSQERIYNRLAGGNDADLDNLVDGVGVSKISTVAKMATNTNLSSMKSDVASLYKEKFKNQDQADNDFKLMSELAYDSLYGLYNDMDANKEIPAKILEYIKNIVGDVKTINNNINVLNEKRAVQFAGVRIENVYHTMNVISDLDLGGNNTGTPYQEDYYNLLYNLVKNNQERVNEIEKFRTSAIISEATAKKLDNFISLIKKANTEDAKFFEDIKDQDMSSLSWGQLKKVYTDRHPEIKQARANIAVASNEKKVEDNKAANDKKVENAKDTTVKAIEGDNILNAIDIENQMILEKRNLASGVYVSPFNRGDKVTGNLYIETVQKLVKNGEKGAQYEQFINILAVRNVLDAVRGGKGNKLANEVGASSVKDMFYDLSQSKFLQNFYLTVKNDSKKFKSFNEAILSGHGGKVEDMIKSYSNTVSLADLPANEKFSRYFPTIKERIEGIQDAVKKTDDKTLYVDFACEVLVARAVAEAKRGEKRSLDKPISTDMINKAKEIGNKLKKDPDFINLCNNIDIKKYIVKGHGGELYDKFKEKVMSSNIKEGSFARKFLIKNTIKGIKEHINESIVKLQNDLVAIEKADKTLIEKNDLKSDINKEFTLLAAKAVTISEMEKEVTDANAYSNTLKDISVSDFTKKVNKLHKSDEFKDIYSEMITNKDLKEFNVDTISSRYNAIQQVADLDKGVIVEKSRHNSKVSEHNKGLGL